MPVLTALTAQALFREMDADGSDALDKGEVQKLCKRMGHKLSKKGLKQARARSLLHRIDRPNFPEFRKFC